MPENNKNINLFLSGGLGNVLFQFIAASYLKEHKSKNVIINDTLVNKNFITNNILNWKIHPFIANKLFRDKFQYSNKFHLVGLLNLFFSKLLKKPFVDSVYQRTNFYDLHSDYKFLLGYYQNLKFYDDVWFDSKLNEIAMFFDIKLHTNRIVVHYRGTDSIWAKNNSYYYERIFHEIKTLNNKVYFVTDDKIKCIEAIKEFKITNYSFFNSNIKDDFKFLAESQTIYCSPSTFSWWSSIINSDSKNITMPLYFKNRFPVEKKIRYI